MEALKYLRSTKAVRDRCGNILGAVLAGHSDFFTVDLSAITVAAQRVAKLTNQRFPDGKIPYHSRWRHFEAGGIDRLASLPKCRDIREQARSEIDLAVTAVLLDAGSGPDWQYQEMTTGWQGGRSEGLGVAAFHCFVDGLFGMNDGFPQANAQALKRVTTTSIAKAFQVTVDNPLVGLEGRTALLVRLSKALSERADLFGIEGRPGRMFDRLVSSGNQVNVADIFDIVTEGFGPIWLTANELDGQALGDCWPHPYAGGEDRSKGWVPFHKLSQWMTYSLLEPFERAGLKISGLESLTGLPEYRNGGLLIDCGVIRPMHSSLLTVRYKVNHPLIVEWRALTVALLDRVATQVRVIQGLTEQQLPLACVLEGGTWAAGRVTAQELRGGLPPIQVNSDGTVF
jgi:Protein of unknown function (DUF1688)